MSKLLSKTEATAMWLLNNPDKSPGDAITELGVSNGTAYNAYRIAKALRDRDVE